MNNFWRNLFRDNPMNIESLRAVRRFTTLSACGGKLQKNVTRVLFSLVGLIYVWLLIGITCYREDLSVELTWIEFLMLTALIPMTLYGAISGERERLTWDSLILTRLSPARILVGKLLWRLGMALGVILLFQPPLLLGHYMSKFSVAYTLPGLIWVQLCLLSWSIFLAAFTLWISARTRRSITTLSAVVMSLLGILVLIPGLFTAFGGSSLLEPRASYDYADSQTRIVEAPALAIVGGIFVQLNPGTIISGLSKSTSKAFEMQGPWNDTWGMVLMQLAPVIYLALAALCIVGTMRALARLGLPTAGKR